MPAIIIAIDGHSSCGKSTLAKALAARLGYGYVDTGAMYRAAALYFMRNGIAPDDEARILQALETMHIHFEHTESGNRTFLNGEDVEDAIRTMEVSRLVSPVAAISSVRSHMVRLQQRMGEHKGIVMDGRDIGTVVFPDAELKIFLTAETETRVQRRLLELRTKGFEWTAEQVRSNLLQRDHIDSTREDSPLRQAEDAVVIDNTHLSPAQQLQLALDYAEHALMGEL